MKVLSQLTLDAVTAEAQRAHLVHGPDGSIITSEHLGDLGRLAALGEEYGEVCRLLTYDHRDPDDAEWRARFEKELIQLASVALSWVEHLNPTTQVVD